jgi:thioredoxin reductase (NADPH)
MPESRHSKVLILGSGPAGYTAAIYAARANLEPMLISGMEEGGQLSITTDVENYPGFAEVIQGPWLMEQMKGQADHVGTQLITDLIVEVDLDERPFRCKGDSGAVYTGDTLIIATGAQARWLGLPGETKFRGFGVSACATCDGFFYRDKEVAVVGGGNTAVEEALFLTNFASKVSLVHRRDALRAEKILQDRLFQNAKIEVLWDPATQLFRGKLEMDSEGYILTRPDSTATEVPGVYAAGDVRDKIYRQAVTAAGMGCMAALEAEKYLAEMESEAAQAAQ